jgi:hypothetical protein
MMRWPVVGVNNQASTDAVNAEESADGGHCCKSVAEIFYRIFMGSAAEVRAGRADLAEVSPGIRFWPHPHPGGFRQTVRMRLIVNELTENKVQNSEARVRKFLIRLGVIFGGSAASAKEKRRRAALRT